MSMYVVIHRKSGYKEEFIGFENASGLSELKNRMKYYYGHKKGAMIAYRVKPRGTILISNW